ncbi:MAG: WhiB family transcriptional regulator [Actinomycetota bacterium]
MIEPKFRSDPRGSVWVERARCLDEDPELFFPVGTSGPALEQAARAKAVCRGCDVIDTCLAWALDTYQDAGVWGGLDEEERREIRRARRRAVAAAGAPSDRIAAGRAELVSATG